MRDALCAITLVLALIVGFSRWGPVMPEESGDGPGLDRPGESGLMVYGGGLEIVTVTGSAPPQEEQTPGAESSPAEETAGQTGTQGGSEPQEAHMDMSNLIWYIVGVATVLIGEIAGVGVAAAWQRLRRGCKEE